MVNFADELQAIQKTLESQRKKLDKRLSENKSKTNSEIGGGEIKIQFGISETNERMHLGAKLSIIQALLTGIERYFNKNYKSEKLNREMSEPEKLRALQELSLAYYNRALEIPHSSFLSRGLNKAVGFFSSHPQDYVQSDTAKLVGQLKKLIDNEVALRVEAKLQEVMASSSIPARGSKKG